MSGLLAFWAEAGISCAFDDEAQDRLAEGARRLAPPAPASLIAPPPFKAPTATANGEQITDPQLLLHARAAAAAASDLTALETAIAAFPWGGLKALASSTVFARGQVDAEVMIIGEGPGSEEDRLGQPFVGRSGQLLDRMLAAVALTDRVFITNTVFWRPPGNRTPSAAEQALCAPFLERAVALVAPRVLLLTGGAAAKAMLGRSEGITTLRGRWFEWIGEGRETPVPALATLHPAFLLRQPAAKGLAWRDILAIMSRLDPPA